MSDERSVHEQLAALQNENRLLRLAFEREVKVLSERLREAEAHVQEMAALLEDVAEVCGPKFNSYPAAQELAERAADLLKRIKGE